MFRIIPGDRFEVDNSASAAAMPWARNARATLTAAAVRIAFFVLALTAPARGQPLEWYFDPNINGSVHIEGGGRADDHAAPGFDIVHNLRTLWTPGAPYAMGFLTYGTSYSVSFDETAIDLPVGGVRHPVRNSNRNCDEFGPRRRRSS